mgnify:CR=1 FL=1
MEAVRGTVRNHIVQSRVAHTERVQQLLVDVNELRKPVQSRGVRQMVFVLDGQRHASHGALALAANVVYGRHDGVHHSGKATQALAHARHQCASALGHARVGDEDTDRGEVTDWLLNLHPHPHTAPTHQTSVH